MLDKIYEWTTSTFLYSLEQTYNAKHFCVVSFLYFANAVKFHLLEDDQTQDQMSYAVALRNADFLLLDGIALQVWKYLNKKPRVRWENLNWTDLTPKILRYFSEKYDADLYIYSLYHEKIGKSQDWLHKAKDKLETEFKFSHIYCYQSHYHQRGTDFPWNEMTQSIDKQKVNIFLNCTGSPFQEKRIEENRQWFIENKMMVLNVWWFIDFYSWFEKRAPEWVVKARIWETIRRILDNPKKNGKKFLAMFGIFRLLWKKLLYAKSKKNVDTL